ncbi:MAG: histidine--tRNA ligase [Planctomycetota bacterium]|jgi:histidyl-tRNA synthetase
MKIPPVKGTRDFYPAQMTVRNFIVDGWKKVSFRNGFQEYDGPIFEYLKMFQIKSGEEIAEQLFSLTDRGGRELAIRPEITPTLARMVNQQISSLARPIKWFSVPRLCRAERPQKGRFREFFQWNIDIIGVEDSRADAEVIFTTVDYLRSVGLTDKDIKVKISSRKLLAGFLEKIGVTKKKLEPLYALLDKKPKLPIETFEQLLSEQLSDAKIADKVKAFMNLDSFSDIVRIVKPNDKMEEADEELAGLVKLLKEMGVWNYCCFDPGIVRGLAYYTGIVFEVHDIKGQLRAICGGGRYDNLLKDFGGPEITGTGMGMGDCILEILLREKGLLSETLPTKQLDYFIIPITPFEVVDVSVALAAKLRTKGYCADFSYRTSKLSKQLKQVAPQNAKKCIILGDEFDNNQLVIKDMATGEQELVDKDKFLSQLPDKSK